MAAPAEPGGGLRRWRHDRKCQGAVRQKADIIPILIAGNMR